MKDLLTAAALIFAGYVLTQPSVPKDVPRKPDLPKPPKLTEKVEVADQPAIPFQG